MSRILFMLFGHLMIQCLAHVLANDPTDYHEVDSVTAEALKSAKYALVIDAGSTGSRLRMYDVGTGITAISPSEEDESAFETDPGLSSYADNPDAAGPSLKGIITAATKPKYIAQGDFSQTVLWVKATAGMRTLASDVVDIIFEKLGSWMKKKENCPFIFVGAEVLSGGAEGLFGYIGMNYLKGSLFAHQSERVGILDMGGASMQITHSPDSSILASQVSFYVNDERRNVYSRSQMCFGINEAHRRAMTAFVSKLEVEAGEHKYPCFNKGYIENFTLGGKTFTLTGTGDTKACSDLAEGLLHKNYECVLQPCSIMGIYMAPFVDATFHAISTYFFVANSFGLVGWKEQKAVSPAAILSETEKFCDLTAEEARVSSTPWKFRRIYCFAGHYIVHVLRAYGFEDTSDQIIFMRKYKGYSADWSLGSVMYELQSMPLVLPGWEDGAKKSVLAVPAKQGWWYSPNVENIVGISLIASIGLNVVAVTIIIIWRRSGARRIPLLLE